MADRKTPRVYTARGPAEGEDWAAVAAALNERMQAHRVGQQQLAELSGISVSTLRLLQHGAGRRVQNRTLTAISRALGWPDDYLLHVLTGNRHTSDTPADADQPLLVALQILDGIREIRDELRRIGRRLDEMSSSGHVDTP